MSLHLPRPYPDEPLYGAISRLVARTGWSGRHAGRQVFGLAVACSVDLPGRLEAVADNLAPGWRMSADDILAGHTLFPFHAAGVKPEVVAEVARMLKYGTGRGAHARLGLLSRSGRRPPTLRLCPACLEEDMARDGEAHWRRAHQLPGMIACHRHPVALVRTAASPYDAMKGVYHDAGSTRPADRGGGTALGPGQIRVAHEVAARCARVLQGSGLPDCAALARSKGLVGARGGIDAPRVAEQVASTFGTDLVAAFGYDAAPPRGIHWVRTHLLALGQRTFPLPSVLIGLALEALPDAPHRPAPPTRGRAGPPRPPREGEVQASRALWREAVAEAAPPKITTARRRRSHLAARLRAWDRTWFDAFNDGFRVKREHAANAARRDLEALAVVLDAERRLAAVEEGPRRSASAILARAGLHRGGLAGLPKAKAFLARVAESTAHHRERKLRAAAIAIRSGGREPSPSALAEASGLGHAVVRDPAFRDLVRGLCTRGPACPR